MREICSFEVCFHLEMFLLVCLNGSEDILFRLELIEFHQKQFNSHVENVFIFLFITSRMCESFVIKVGHFRI